MFYTVKPKRNWTDAEYKQFEYYMMCDSNVKKKKKKSKKKKSKRK